ncbi:MAG: hypothetical protein GY754_08510 [bacterium]|nr:hypothetical protein [bacterium]
MGYKTFQEFTKNIVKEFIQTVVFVDDKAYEFPSGSSIGPIATEVDEPEKKKREVVDEKEEDKIKEPILSRPDHSLHVAELVKAFTSSGVVCSVINPKFDNIYELIPTIATKADVVVLDWEFEMLGAGNGYPEDPALDIILKIIKNDEKDFPRLRLILIYTTEIIEDVAEKTVNAVEANGTKFTHKEEDLLAYANESLRIRIIGKKGFGKDKNKYDEEELPEIIFEEFAKMADGLLPSLVLKSFSTIRNNTHRVLARFNKDLDPAIIAHKSLLDSPEDSILNSEQWISDEINSLIMNSDSGQVLNDENIDLWIDEKCKKGYKKLNYKGVPISINHSQLKKIPKEGFYSYLKENRTKKLRKKNENTREIINHIFMDLPSIYYPLKSDKKKYDIEYNFSQLTSSLFNYNHKLPTLKLGTILFHQDKYWLCLQPLCDTVRIKTKKRAFLLVKLIIKEGRDFDFVVNDSDNWIPLRISYRIYDSKLIIFKSNPKEIVEGKESETGGYFFEAFADNSDSKELVQYKFISELKNMYAQRILNNFASNLSRVGLDEFEWLRRS